MSTILIVDDSRVARLSLKRSISGIVPEATMLEAACADEAMDLVNGGQSVDLAIIDYNMPDKTGIDLAEQLVVALPQVRMALCTANIQDALVERAKKLGMTFIPKPPEAAVLEAFLKGDA